MHAVLLACRPPAAQGWYSSGFGYGVWLGALSAAGFRVIPVPSVTWKRAFRAASPAQVPFSSKVRAPAGTGGTSVGQTCCADLWSCSARRARPVCVLDITVGLWLLPESNCDATFYQAPQSRTPKFQSQPGKHGTSLGL